MGIGSTLQRLIESQGTNVNEVATATGVNPQTLYSLIKRDSTKANIDDLYKVAQHLGVSLDYFYSGYIAAKTEPPAGPEGQTGGKITLEESNKLLEALGYFQEGAELSDRDLAFLGHVIGLLDSWFGQRQ
jgi:transcriptional regulator with XRE-family HTH domain|nr:MAG TPA: helix-turn-helix protein [Bacteriophage sp.]